MSGSILSDCTPRRITLYSRDAVERMEDGNIILQKGHTLFLLKENESEIWRMCDGRTRVEWMISEVVKRYGVPQAHAQKQIIKFLVRLQERGLLELDPMGLEEGSGR